MPRGHFVLIQTKADDGYCLSARSDGVVLAPKDQSDARQLWYKDESWSHFKDEKGFPCFALINKATRQALTHTGGEKTKVTLSDYFGDSEDKSTLWTLSGDVCGGWNALRPCHDTALNLSTTSERVTDGTGVCLTKWHKEDNQCWELVPAPRSTEGTDEFHRVLRVESPVVNRSIHHLKRYLIAVQAGEGYTVSARSDGVVLAPTDPSDERQHWIKDDWWGCKFQDSLGQPAFILYNVASGQALSHAPGEGQPVSLAKFVPNVLDHNLLWTCQDVKKGWLAVRPATNVRLTLDALRADKKHGGPTDGSKLAVYKWNEQENQLWQFLPL